MCAHTIARSVIASTLLALALIVSAEARRWSPQLQIHNLDPNDLTSATEWQFLPSVLQNVDVVALPEPIHMTHEFPIVRLGIVKFLNEQMGLHVLAMEGSLVDSWATQDRFLASPRAGGDAADARLALFPLWNTPEVQQLFQYEAASWATPTPLYITAYDVQPGTGKGTHGVEAFRLLADRLATYSPPPTSLQLEAWLNDLRPLTGACKEFTPANTPALVRAIDQLELWIQTASPAVAARFPHIPLHAASLQLLPTNLRSSLTLCSGMAAVPKANYKALRDREGAAFAELLLGKSADRKLMLWAHWSHLAYDDPVAGLSVGRELRQRLGKRLYTILPLAERGSAIVIFPNRASDDDVGFGWVRPGSDKFSKRMKELSSTPFFLDLRDPAVQNDDAFAGNQSLWVESRQVRLPLIKNTDSIVWLKHVRAPELPVAVLLIMGGMHYRAMLALSTSLLVVVSLSALVWRWRRTKA
jgi:erythromycin esterase-like protein